MTTHVAVNNYYGATLLLAAAAVFTMDVSVLRILNPEVPFTVATFFRSLRQLLIVALLITFRSPELLRSPRWPMLMLMRRGLITALGFKRIVLASGATNFRWKQACFSCCPALILCATFL